MVRTSAYRQPPTPEGLKKIENDNLEWFDTEMFSNFNTGILEEYMDEKNKKHSFERSKFVWKKVLIGIAIGSAFALINQYVGLKVGMIVSGAWYISYLLGLALNWGPTETNIASGASTGASATCTGFVFTFPAIYLLAYHEGYIGKNNTFLVDKDMIPALWLPLIAAILAAFMGVMYFIIFRRVWLVEDPLPMPGFQAQVKLMDIANDLTTGAVEQARKSIRIVATWAGLILGFTFLRDFPLVTGPNNAVYEHLRGEDISIMDKLFAHRSFYLHGDVMQPYKTDGLTHIGFNLTPIQIAIGWFMKFRTAMLVSLGSLFTWFVVIPMVVHFNVPIYSTAASGYFSVKDFMVPSQGITPPRVAYGKIARIIAIGAILGGGITALIKMAPVFKTATADIFEMRKEGGLEKRKDYIKGKGWYEWPVTHIPLMMALTFFGVSAVFIIGGFPIIQTFAFSFVLVVTTFFLGAIAVKVAGEVGTTPVSGTTFIILLMLVTLFKALGTNDKDTIIMSLVGSTVFGSAISLSSDIMRDFRVGLYTGTRPYHLMKGELTGILPGAIIAAIGASILSYGLAKGEIVLAAPQAHAFATFTQIMIGGENMSQVTQFLLLGFFIGVCAEILTGMGTAFGLGMYLPLPITLPILVGGGARDLWEAKYLEPKAEKEEWTEKQKTFKTLETYMMATGFIVGEALMGTIVALYLVIPLLT